MGFLKDFLRERLRDGMARDPCRRNGVKPHSILKTFLREIPRKTHNFLTLANKNNTLYRIGVKIYKAMSYS